MKFDDTLQKWAQESYNYLLDRWNVGIGLLMQTLLVTIFGLSYMRDAGGAFVIIISLTLIALHEMFHVRLQKMGAYLPINIAAQKWSEKWVLRIIMIPFIAQTLLIVTLPDLKKFTIAVVEVLLWTVWYYGWTVRIRDRDDTRFRRLHPQHALDTATGSR